MIKISRPVLYTALLGIAAYAVVLVTEPEAPTKPAQKGSSATRRATPSTSSATSSILPEDRTASFPRYAGERRDAFRPGVVAVRGLPVPGGAIDVAPSPTGGNTFSLGPGGRQNWVLTGLAWINGRRSALVENPSTGESVFLKPGDRWKGQRVAAIGNTTMTLINESGQRIALTFPEPQDPETARRGPGTPSPAPAATPAAPQAAAVR